MAVSKNPAGQRADDGVDVAEREHDREMDFENEPDFSADTDVGGDTDFGDGRENTDIDRHRTQDIKATVVALYDTFSRGDRPAFEALISDDFRFTSPYDDAIDRAEFFERCWPNHRQQTHLEVQRIGIDGAGAGAFVTYRVEFRDGHSAENTEWLAFRDGRVASVDVYFGASHATKRSRRDTTRDAYEKRAPGAALDQLAPILGTWKITGENAPRDGQAPADRASLAVEGEETYEMMRGNFFVHGRWTHRFPDGNEHTGISVLGHEPERGSIMCENFDNLGYAREYRVSIDGGTWKLQGAHERATYTFAVDGKSFTVEWESSQDGRDWTPLCRLEARK